MIEKFGNYVIQDNLICEVRVNEIIYDIFTGLEKMGALGVIVEDLILDEESLKKRIKRHHNEDKYYIDSMKVRESGNEKDKYNALNVILKLKVLTKDLNIVPLSYKAIKLGPYRESHIYGSVEEVLEESYYINGYANSLLKSGKEGYGYDKDGNEFKMNVSNLLMYKNEKELKKLQTNYKRALKMLSTKDLLNNIKPDLEGKVKNKLSDKEVLRRFMFLKNNISDGVKIKTLKESGGVFHYKILLPDGLLIELGTNFLIEIRDDKNLKVIYNLNTKSRIDDAVESLERYNIEFLNFIGKLIDGRRNPLK